ncbi:T9SS type A sorting domain-containing protein [Flavobacterium hibisci]|uniref:T9SS type A sorting domain-containing protein n=1 Tax=Flavobacterium hibisci TaxID=1914462 RepID=UPI001CBEF536|nr:T9SS type A sorting domain-containing protein [Flavobacterium hibisci]MBZ4044186.1 T9SS type A sorting domain-containing protein [Flavobacterium hibisci]
MPHYKLLNFIMRKNYVFFVLLLLLNISMFGQKVTLTPTLVNGVAYSSGAINLESLSTSSVSLSVEIKIPTNASVGDQGTIKIYFSKDNASGSNVANGGDGGSIYIGGGNVATRSFSIKLYSGDFNTSGGYIYAEYKTYSGAAYKSSNISVKKNETSTTPTTPTIPEFSDSYFQYIPYGGFPILPEFNNNFVNAENIESQVWVDENEFEYKSQTSNRIYRYGTTLREKTTFNDGRSPVYSREIKVSPTNFYGASTIVDNEIESNQYLTNDENPKTIIGNQATKIDVIQGTGGRRNQSVTTNLTNYQWQSRIKFPVKWSYFKYYFADSKYNWVDITGATEANYTPPKTAQAMEYRRLVLEEKSAPQTKYRKSAASNVVNITPLSNDSTKDIICCDQTVAVDKLANLIVGDYQEFIQWQISKDNVNWEDIFGANGRNYTPVRIQRGDGRRTYINETDGNQELFYRRILFDYEDIKYYTSNVIKIIFESRSTTTNNSIKIYPNPTTSILNIENTRTTVTLSNITIMDQTGNTFEPSSYSIINSNLTQINVSNLPSGIYFLNMRIKAEGSTRGYSHQTTFIKE